MNPLLFTKQFYKLLTLLLVVTSLLAMPLPKVYAAEDDPPTELSDVICTPDKNLFDKIQGAFKTLDIRRTTVNMFNSMLLDVTTHAVFNRSLKGIAECYIWELEQLDGTGADVSGFRAIFEDECGTDMAVDCSDLGETYKVINNDGASASWPTFASSTTAGSLLGMANLLQGAANEPIPVNLAYWWNDGVTRIPFAGRALAAEVTYGGPLVEFVFDFWKYTRNLAYAMLAVILLVVGFMIMTRRKTSPQMAVTAQTAIPRIVLAVIFITFSYPIGALAASLAWSLGQNAAVIVFDTISPLTFNSTGQEFTLGFIMILLIGTLLAVSGIGVILILSVFLAAIAVIILFIVAMIKALMAYLRILFSIIFAPFAFAVGAIPGQEATTTKWFKNLAADVLTIPAIFFTIALTMMLILRSALAGPLDGAWASTILVILLGPFIGIYGMILATRMPKMIKGWIVGEDKPRR